MPCQIKNPANYDLKGLEPHVHGMYDHFASKYGFKKPPVMVFDSDPNNQSKVLGKTAYYDPQSFEIHVFVDGRHPKDVLRSIAHELIHHKQNLEGRLDVGGYTGPGYYLENDDLKEVEHEAMLEGNATMREYEDTRKYKENKDMSLKEWKNNELNQLLLKKFGILKESNNLSEKEVPTYSKEEANKRYDKITDDGPADMSIGHMGDKTEMFRMKDVKSNENPPSNKAKKSNDNDPEPKPPKGAPAAQMDPDEKEKEANLQEDSKTAAQKAAEDKKISDPPKTLRMKKTKDGRTTFKPVKEEGKEGKVDEASCGTGDKKRVKESDNKLEESLRRIINAKKIVFRNKRVK